ncbi:Transcription activator [Homalodisca vitripennis]|nr:Transcription activator [Homalodisca vitripennis]
MHRMSQEHGPNSERSASRPTVVSVSASPVSVSAPSLCVGQNRDHYQLCPTGYLCCLAYFILNNGRPKSGSMLLYSRKKVRYRRDGYCWKKRKDGKTTREDHMKLKVQGTEYNLMTGRIDCGELLSEFSFLVPLPASRVPALFSPHFALTSLGVNAPVNVMMPLGSALSEYIDWYSSAVIRRGRGEMERLSEQQCGTIGVNGWGLESHISRRGRVIVKDIRIKVMHLADKTSDAPLTLPPQVPQKIIHNCSSCLSRLHNTLLYYTILIRVLFMRSH